MASYRWNDVPNPPWPLGDDESLDIAYFKVMRELKVLGYTIIDESRLKAFKSDSRGSYGAD
jgi:hypothetical protein